MERLAPARSFSSSLQIACWALDIRIMNEHQGTHNVKCLSERSQKISNQLVDVPSDKDKLNL